jgi:hypothetical protein
VIANRFSHNSPGAPRVLIFSIGLNGYGLVYARCIASQRAYAKRQGYDYVLVNRPLIPVEPCISSWVKIPLMLAALAEGYDWVFFVDADCEISRDAPPITSIHISDKSLYMVPGYSGRVNAGVIIAVNSSATRSFFRTLIDNCGRAVPEEDQALYENGHVIHYSKGQPFLHLLDRRWNNNADPVLKDFIRHYSAGGPMRILYRTTLLGKAAHILNRLYTKFCRTLGSRQTPPDQLQVKINSLAAQCLQKCFKFERGKTDRAATIEDAALVAPIQE